MKFFITLTIILFNTYIFAQNTPNGLVLYGHKQSLGMGAPIGIDYNATLTFSNNKSSYVCKKDSLEGGHVNEHITSRSGNTITLSQKITNEKGFIYFYDKNKNISKSRDIGFMYVKEPIPKINWKISSESKKIGDFVCTKATAHFRGRDYTAWFTTVIPLPFGPWKLQGLPGLILEAYDTNKEVYFYFKSVKYPYNGEAFIEDPDPTSENKKWITFDDFKLATIKAYNRGVENFRLVTEQNSDNIIESKKPLMKNAYLEVFDH